MTLQMAASLPFADGTSVEGRFTATLQRENAEVRPTGSIDLIDADGAVVRSVVREQVERSTPDTRNNHGFLVGASYITAILIPVVGIIVALYTAVAERRRAIRRHAIALAGVSLLAGGAYYLIISSIVNANQDRNVAADLRSLLDSNVIQYDSVGGCAHQSGNQYVCTVTKDGQQISVQVTDDGNTIYEQGISATGP